MLGLVLEENPWRKFYRELKQKDYALHKLAVFHSYEGIKTLLAQSGFAITRIVSTLFQKPDVVAREESPRAGYFPNAGFTIIIADKN